MDVFLVPLDRDRYELYCEPRQAPDLDVPARRGRIAWATGVFRRVLAEGEAARQAAADGRPAEGGRVRRAVARRLAEVVAEQRLLWYLRKETAVSLRHPDDMAPAVAIDQARTNLRADRDKHLRWCLIDALLALAMTPIALVPGPNFLAYYFIFRSVGHLLSLLGARHGLARVDWQSTPEPALRALRQALAMDAAARRAAVDAIGHALGLERLSRLVDGTPSRR